ncbi:hypothetical protein E5329_16925 [Petralouisia muris]|uniref:Uncharacterized protein n=1 Tax=Petralouisia muris TaxID=3032872 RepID=A0AC61RTH6_9FIRM|nr:ParB N-terminal domain-containing protein [Petralouisia muris]TGY94979.1 hypothetical protein E5329_16925 [Petralouisia muris]
MAYVNIKDLTVDKEFEELLPVLTPEESEKLENSILQYGMLDPIKIWQEPSSGDWIIIDGHNRYNILKKHDIEWHYWQDYKIMGELESREDVKQWMLEQQLGRRNLTETERYEIVQKFKSVFQKKAKENQSLGGKGLPNLVKVNVQEEMAKSVGVSKGTYSKLDKVMQSDNEEVKQKLREKKISVDKAYQEIKNPKPKEKESITPEQKIIEFDNRMNEIDKEISSLRTERESLMRRRSSLFESLDIPCELKYEFVECKYEYLEVRHCIFYIEVSGKKQILLECGVYSDETPSSTWIRHIPEKYKNDFIMLWKKAHKEDVEWNHKKTEERSKKFEKEYKDALINDTNKCKDFYKQCYKTLAKSVHPDEGGDVEAMQCLNQLKVMWGI